eukprot:1578304-Alexandrium_andersonii.AAC.1
MRSARSTWTRSAPSSEAVAVRIADRLQAGCSAITRTFALGVAARVRLGGVRVLADLRARVLACV